MKLQSLLFFCFIILYLSTLVLLAQDSTKTYKLKEITVSGDEFVQPKPVSIINKSAITSSDASSVSEIAKYIPSLKLQTNSRGESQFFLRGYGVRQLALFFDNIPLSIPWDNRIDLSLIPTESLSSISVFGGTPSVLFGANTLSGVISVKSFEPTEIKKQRNFLIQFGNNDFQKYSGNYTGNFEALTYLVSFMYDKSNDFNLPSSIKDAYTNSENRLNSNHKKFAGFLKLSYNLSYDSQISLSSSYINAVKGVPPEMDVGKPRFWRYPLWQKLTFILNGSHYLSNKFGRLKYAFSLTKFKMKIDQYKNESYTNIDDNEEDNDLTFYGRVIYSIFFNNNSLLNISASGLNSTHKEKFLNSGNFETTYSQNTLSIGSEYEFHHDKFSVLAGVGLDNQSTPRTGNKPKQGTQNSLNFKTSIDYFLNNNLSTQIVYGKKTRFPTLRELYSGALGRFVPNPNLQSEVAYNLESNWKYMFNKSKFNLSIFYSLLNNGIQRITLPGKQFKRVNKDKIRTWGVEFASKFTLINNFKINFNVSYLNSFAKNENGEFKDTLEYKPQIISGLQLLYSGLKYLNFLIEINYIGTEYGLKEGDEFYQKLPEYLLLNSRVEYSFDISNFTKLKTFVRINNIFDKLYYTQWSLPKPGRQLWLGLMLNY